MIRYIQSCFIGILLGSIIFANSLYGEADSKSRQDKDIVESGQTAETNPKEQIADYSKGFAKFYRFGLPDVADTEYIKLNMYSSALPTPNYLGYQAGVDGNAWLISEDKKRGTAQIVLNQGAEATVYDQKKLLQAITEKNKTRAQTLLRFNHLTEGKLTGQWQKADLKSDAEKITKHIEHEMEKDHFWGKDYLGIWFLFAVHLHKKGLTYEANKLAAVLFDAAQSKRTVILQALNALADTQYGVAYAEFKADHDWEKYSANVAKLYKLYKKGWKQEAGIKKLSSMLTKRAEGVSFLNDKDFTPDECQILKDLIDKTVTEIDSGIWILNNDGDEKDDAESSPIRKIMNKGIAAVPFLIKLIGNQTLIMADEGDIRTNEMLSGRLPFIIYSSRLNGSNEIFNRMKRPMTLDEVARRMLNTIVMKIDNNGNKVRSENSAEDGDDFRELCEIWYKKNKNRSKIDLARIYMEKGSKIQKAYAVLFLMNEHAKVEYPIIEKYLLETKRDRRSNTFKNKIAVCYAGRRGVEAKDFVDKYIGILDPGGKIERDYKEKKSIDDKNQKRTIQLIEILRAMISDKTVEDSISDVLSGKREWNSKTSSLIAERLKMSDIGIDKKIAILLKGAAGAAEKGDNKLFTDLMTMVVRCGKNIPAPTDSFNFMKKDIAISAKWEKPDPVKNRDLWKSLINSKQHFGGYGESDTITVGGLSAVYYEIIFGDKTSDALVLYVPILGKLLYEQIIKRANQRIDGAEEDDLPKLPSVSELTTKECDEKIDSVVKKVRTSQNIRKVLESLSLDEKILLKQGVDKNQKLNALLLPLANRVVQVKAKAPGSEKFAKFAGNELSAEMVNELRAFALDALSDGKNIYCRIYRKPALEGITILIAEIPEDQLPAELKKRGKDTKEVLVASLNIPGAFNTKAYWSLSAEEEHVSPSESSDDDDLFGDMEKEIMDESKKSYIKKQKNFNEKVKLFAAGQLNSMLSGGIYFFGGVE